eukprot:5988230-Pleurochrysis_carterae.AAC.1
MMRRQSSTHHRNKRCNERGECHCDPRRRGSLSNGARAARALRAKAEVGRFIHGCDTGRLSEPASCICANAHKSQGSCKVHSAAWRVGLGTYGKVRESAVLSVTRCAERSNAMRKRAVLGAATRCVNVLCEAAACTSGNSRHSSTPISSSHTARACAQKHTQTTRQPRRKYCRSNYPCTRLRNLMVRARRAHRCGPNDTKEQREGIECRRADPRQSRPISADGNSGR